MLKSDLLVKDKLLSRKMLLWYSALLIFNFIFLFGIHYPTRIKYSDLRWKNNCLTINVPEEEMIKINVNDSMYLVIGYKRGQLKKTGVIKLVSDTIKNGGYDVCIAISPSRNIGASDFYTFDPAPLIDSKKHNLFSILFQEK